MENRHEIQGGRTTGIVYGDYPDPLELQQIYALLDLPAFAGAKVRIMPDHHAGKGCVIGFTCPIAEKDPHIIASLVGVDIGCGVMAIRLTGISKKIDFEAFDKHLRTVIPSGFHNRTEKSKELPELYNRYIKSHLSWEEFQTTLNTIDFSARGDGSKIWLSIGSLGGGNHFCELDEDETGMVWLTIHSGSRNFGLRIAEKHQHIAEAKIGKWGGLAWLTGDDAVNYLREMRFAQQIASLNRLVMASELTRFFGLDLNRLETITSVHNFIGADNIIRKGAISAYKGEKVIIPWNMEQGIIIGEGLGHSDWNYSAPHGAGRKMARGKAKRELSLEVFKENMQKAGVWSSCIGKDTLDESAAVYKDPKNIESTITDTVRVTMSLHPLYNFKAGGD